MKNCILIVLLLSINSTNIQADTQDTTRILFIGNSITYYNDMPETFENIANSLGNTVKVTKYTPGGTGIVNHVSDANVYNLFRQAWDYVIIQPGSNESPGYSYTKEVTMGRIDTLLDSLYNYNPCTKVLFYQIPYGVFGTSQSDITSYNNSLDLILENNKYWADSIKSFFAPVGEAFRASWNSNTNIMLWVGYSNVHPNARGSYIAACVFYNTIFQSSCNNTNIITSLSPEVADSCQNIADTIVLNHFSDWRINAYNQFVDFSYNESNDTVFFENLSLNYDSVLWDFGDGFYSKLINPIHLYSLNGSYNIVLTTYKHGCSQSVSEIISYTGISEINNSSFKIYPNPGNGNIEITVKNIQQSKCKIEIFNYLGQQIYCKSNCNEHEVVNINNYNNGVYVIKVYIGNGIYTKKYIKNDY